MPNTTPRHAIRSDPHGREATKPAPTRSRTPGNRPRTSSPAPMTP